MSPSNVRPPRLLVFVWFIAAVGVLAGGLVLRTMNVSAGVGETLPYIVCAFFVGQGVGEWRGLRYARFLQRNGPSS
jgi:hypothetical protein